MNTRARTVTVISLALLILDFFTLENRVVTTSPRAQTVGGIVFVVALAGLALGLVGMVFGRRERRVSPSEASVRTVPYSQRFRRAKLAVALSVLLTWSVGMPVYAYYSRLVKSADFVPGPWIADAFLSLFAVAAQLVAPTPIALSFWPSILACVYLLFSRKDRPVTDAIFGLVAVGPVAGLAYVLLRGIEL